MPRLKEKYDSEVKPKLKEQFGIENDHAVPKLVKVVVNMGVSGSVENKARVESAAKDLALITGQAPTIRKARKSISSFKLREGMPIGCAVTLRRARMWEFTDRLVSVVLPRIRDFRGVKDNLDGRGNFSLGLSEQTVFPEIELDKIEFSQGMDITFVTTAKTDEQGHFLLKQLGMPFRTEAGEGERKRKRRQEMAKTCWINKCNQPPKFKTRAYTRCGICGRSRAVYRKFGICRICLRERALLGEIPGMRKSSW